ncbi:MAG TPA: hypothetical protein VN666_09785 [Nitrospira sp.]|nr:hypothetical protein [Nitrospira sp.]
MLSFGDLHSEMGSILHSHLAGDELGQERVAQSGEYELTKPLLVEARPGMVFWEDSMGCRARWLSSHHPRSCRSSAVGYSS